MVLFCVGFDRVHTKILNIGLFFLFLSVIHPNFAFCIDRDRRSFILRRSGNYIIRIGWVGRFLTFLAANCWWVNSVYPARLVFNFRAFVFFFVIGKFVKPCADSWSSWIGFGLWILFVNSYEFEFWSLQCEWLRKFWKWILFWTMLQGRVCEFIAKWGLCPGGSFPSVVTSVCFVLLCVQDQGNRWNVTRSWWLIYSRVIRWNFQLMFLHTLYLVAISLTGPKNYKLTE